MAFSLTKSFPRLWSLEYGIAMVVTDLHGDWEIYQRYRDRFIDLQAKGQADCLIFTGDLIHRNRSDQDDKSLEILFNVIKLQAHYGRAIIYLLGNHELPHIYGISLAKGDRIYTPTFEQSLSESGRRADIINLFVSLPFYLRTRAGVCLTHAGAAPPIVEPTRADQLFTWSHRQALAEAEAKMNPGEIEGLRQGYARLFHGSYEEQAKYYLAVSGPDDPRYNHLLRGFITSNLPTFGDVLWPALFTRCEKEYGQSHYQIFLDALLKELSVDYVPQQFLVAGHMGTSKGYQIIGKRHLRLASGRHAQPREAGLYLLFDAGRPIHSMKELQSGLGSVFK